MLHSNHHITLNNFFEITFIGVKNAMILLYIHGITMEFLDNINSS